MLLQAFDHKRRFYYVVGLVIPIASLFDHVKVILLHSSGEECDKSAKLDVTTGTIHSGNVLFQVL